MLPINNISLFFSDATVDIARPSPCTTSSQAILFEAFRWRTRSDHVTRNVLAARNNEAYGQGNSWQSLRQSFAIIKNTGHGNFVIGRFQIELEMDYLSKTSLCTVATFPIDTPSPIFSEGRGRLYTGYLERIIPSPNCPSKLTDKVRRIVHSKLKLFHFQIKTYYLCDANHQTDTHLTRIIRL